MKSKNSFLGLSLCGLLFVILGIILFCIQKGDAVLILVACLDLLLGVSLLASSAIPKKDDKQNETQQDPSPAVSAGSEFQPDASVEAAPAEDYFADDLSDDLDDDLDLMSDPSQLAAREGELRAAAKRAAEEATRAKKAATYAVQEAKQAEKDLQDAEDELANLDPASQRAAMRRIDMLAQVAAEKSEIAVSEARKAKLAIRNAREAAELHSMAMDAAAAALGGDDEFAEFD